MKPRIPSWLLAMMPTRVITRRTPSLMEPSAIAHTLDAERLQSILRSAEGGSMEELFSLYRDITTGHAHTQTEFTKRKLGVLGDVCGFSAVDEKNEAQMLVTDEIQIQCENLDNWMDSLLFALDSTLYPVSILEKTFRPSARPGVRFELAALTMVPYRLIDYTDGRLMLWDTDDFGNKLGTRHVPDPMRYIVHRGHALVGTPDTWGGPMRAVTFWYLFAVMDRAWWARFLDRFGSPFMEASYDETDEGARYTLEAAFSAATRLFGIAVPKGVSIKMHQASTQGADAFKIFHQTANEEISKAILGQTMSSTAANTGLGSSQGNMQEEVRQDYRQFDASRLAHTLRTQLFQPLCQLNGWTVPAPRISWGGESALNLEATSAFLGALPGSGCELTEEGIEIISKRSGIPIRRGVAAGGPVAGRSTAQGDPAPATPVQPEDEPTTSFNELTLALERFNRGGDKVMADRVRQEIQSRLDAMSADPAALRRLLTPQEIRTRDLHRANDAIALDGAEAFAVAMADTLEPVRKILALSVSQDDFERRFREAFPALPSRSAAGILAAAMISNAANAALAFPAATQKA